MKTQRFKPAKHLISAAVSPEARSLLEQKATLTGNTMSDVLDKLIRECFKPKRGLAKRVEKDKALVQAEYTKERAAIEAKLFTLNLEMSSLEKALDVKLSTLEVEWNSSLQSKLIEASLQDLDASTYANDISFWLFSHRVFSMRNKSGQWSSGLGLAKACQSWMNSPLLPDKYMAADLVAETEMAECPEYVYEYMVTTFYNGSELEAFTDFCKHDVNIDGVYTGFMTNMMDKAAHILPGLELLIDTRKQAREDLK